MLNLQIMDMTCGHCVSSIIRAVEGVAPQATLAFDLSAHRLQVDGASDPNAIEAAIREAGYEPVRQD